MIFVYNYETINGNYGSVTGEGKAEAINILLSSNRRPKALKLNIKKSLSANFGKNRLEMSDKEAVQFSKNISMFLNVLQDRPTAVKMALDTLGNKDKIFPRLSAYNAALKNGMSQAESIRAIGFPGRYFNVVSLGEESQQLANSFDRIRLNIEERLLLKKEIRKALIGPTITFLLIISVFIFILLFVFPKMLSLFGQIGGTANTDSTFLTFDKFLINNRAIIAFFLVFSLISFISFFLTKYGREFILALLSKIPIFKVLFQYIHTITFTTQLEFLLLSGKDVNQALEDITNAAKISEKIIYKKMLLLLRGQPLSAAIAAVGSYFHPTLASWVRGVEEAGRLVPEIPNIRKTYEGLLQDAFANLKAWISPILVIVSGIFVAITGLAYYGPMYSILNNFMLNMH